MTTVSHRVPAEVDVRRVSGSIGAEIYGIDLRRNLRPDQVSRIRSLLLEHLLFFFPQAVPAP